MGLPTKYGETIEVIRYIQGAIDPATGYYVAGGQQPTSFKATVMPMTPKEMELLPAGYHETQGITIDSEKQLFPGSEKTKAQGDLIKFRGEQFRVLKVELRDQLARLRHYKSFAVKFDGVK